MFGMSGPGGMSSCSHLFMFPVVSLFVCPEHLKVGHIESDSCHYLVHPCQGALSFSVSLFVFLTGTA